MISKLLVASEFEKNMLFQQEPNRYVGHSLPADASPAKAEVLLMNSPLSIAEVAYAVGFDNSRYFSRVFSEENGVSPSSFRDRE